MIQPKFELDTGTILRRSVFFLALILLTLGNLFLFFRGLNAPMAMDQAQIAREIARGNGFTTKFIRPIAYEESKLVEGGGIVPFTNFRDTYHSPLNPLINAAVLKLVGADDSSKWRMAKNDMVFPLDRVIATVSTIFFILSIGVVYLLVSRIFDGKVAGVTAIIMLFSEYLWEYSLSGLPQMLMLFLFSTAIYFIYRAIEDSTEGRIPFVKAIIAGVLLTLLSLTHFLGIWLTVAYIVFAAIYFRPRGILGISVLAILIAPLAFIMVRNFGISGSPFGVGYLNLYNGIGANSEDFVMRSKSLNSFPIIDKGIFSQLLRSMLLQVHSIVPFLAGIIVAPVFFISLFHAFKRPAIATFRWVILLMFLLSAFGLAIFGINTDPLNPNQIFLLFAPIMTAYGLAFISILWARLPAVVSTPFFTNLHYVIIVLICALPLALNLPLKIRMGLSRNDSGIPHWPPYFAPALNLGIGQWLKPNEITFADQPWAVAWYADRISVWLPPTRLDFVGIESDAINLETPVTGILISPVSHGLNNVSEVSAKYKDFTSLVLSGSATAATLPTGVTLYDKDPKIEEITSRYAFPATLVGFDMVFYADRALRNIDATE